MDTYIALASPDDAATVAELAKELLEEIMQRSGGGQFNVDQALTEARAKALIEKASARYFVAYSQDGEAVGLLALSECHALYAEGAFGVITELYVAPPYRSSGLGSALIERAKVHAHDTGWKRLEVTTPPLPEFERTMAFYEGQGFSITGGRKLKVLT